MCSIAVLCADSLASLCYQVMKCDLHSRIAAQVKLYLENVAYEQPHHNDVVNFQCVENCISLAV